MMSDLLSDGGIRTDRMSTACIRVKATQTIAEGLTANVGEDGDGGCRDPDGRDKISRKRSRWYHCQW